LERDGHAHSVGEDLPDGQRCNHLRVSQALVEKKWDGESRPFFLSNYSP